MWEKVLKNLIIIVFAPFLALMLFYVTRSDGVFTASVLDLTQMRAMDQHQRAVAYQAKDHLFEVFASQKVKSAEVLNLELLFDEGRLTYDVETFSGARSREEWELGVLRLMVPIDSDFVFSEPVFQMSFSWDARDILLAKARIEQEWSVSLLSVGNLGQLETWGKETWGKESWE